MVSGSSFHMPLTMFSEISTVNIRTAFANEKVINQVCHLHANESTVILAIDCLMFVLSILPNRCSLS